MTRAGYTVASGFTLLYVVTASCADNDSTPIPCRPLSHSGAVTPVLVTAFAPPAFFNLTMNQFDARQRYIEEVAGPPTFDGVHTFKCESQLPHSTVFTNQKWELACLR